MRIFIMLLIVLSFNLNAQSLTGVPQDNFALNMKEKEKYKTIKEQSARILLDKKRYEQSLKASLEKDKKYGEEKLPPEKAE